MNQTSMNTTSRYGFGGIHGKQAKFYEPDLTAENIIDTI